MWWQGEVLVALIWSDMDPSRLGSRVEGDLRREGGGARKFEFSSRRPFRVAGGGDSRGEILALALAKASDIDNRGCRWLSWKVAEGSSPRPMVLAPEGNLISLGSNDGGAAASFSSLG